MNFVWKKNIENVLKDDCVPVAAGLHLGEGHLGYQAVALL